MLETGIKGKKEIIVSDEMSAKKVGSGLLDVFATPSMIALVEKTAWESVSNCLEEGQGTVGTKVDIAHIAATPIGMKVTCETTLIEIDRRRLVFEINVFDEVDKIAEGTHERFIVENEKFQAKTLAKKN